ncbi:hypothetical protein EXU57_01455 [Segetibacter sp. 3557_3]|uniref:hypothetical protein n=1 Tax=Segetibacter sp. 3557_3 TaxID=2547429 RepID=UPI0010587696|nr:hypothetical protein [Segetibacter sp. 3557_3]TDH28766.1 hypothetical protein EXU57_01455 [Segetibacter sp. 3557_3]
MAEPKTELRKVRDFGEIITDTFIFITQNFKPLLASFFGIAGVFMLASTIVNGFYQSRAGNLFRDIFMSGRTTEVMDLSFFGTTYFLLLVLTLANLTAMKVAIIAYMKVYDQKGRQVPEMAEVWEEFKKYFLKVLVYSIPLLLLIIAGTVLCIAPGVYLMVVLVPFEIMLMVEDRSFSDAFSRCFDLIKNNFWMSLGVYFVCYLIYSCSAGIIGFVVAILGGALSYFTTKDVGQTLAVGTSILNIFSFLFFIVYFVGAVLNYYNLVERYDGTGMLKRLDHLGTNSDHHQIEEQY